MIFEPCTDRSLSRRNPSRLGRTASLFLVGAGLAGVARGQVVTEFPIPSPGGEPFGIVAGPDGNLWFTEPGFTFNFIGRITAAGVVTSFSIPTLSSGPSGIASGPDGNLWFTQFSTNEIGRITTAGVITEFAIPTTNSKPFGIAPGPDGNLWFTESNANQIGRMTTAGVITEFTIPTALSSPRGIVAGPDGNLWFTESFGYKIGRITTAGVITEFPIPTPYSAPQGIAAGSDGNLWFVEANKIGRTTTAGVVTEFAIPTSGSFPAEIASGPDGNLWFTETIGPTPNKVARITTAGVITEFPVLTLYSGLQGIAAGPDGNLWFAEIQVNQIGRITTGPVAPQSMAVDAHMVTGDASNHNGVLEPGETVQVAPVWKNTLTTPQTFGGTASNLTGPAGPTYTINHAIASYGTVAGGATGDCNSSPGGCYLMTVAGTRPVQHWDATFTEALSPAAIRSSPDTTPLPTKTWTVHIGSSFSDVPTSNPFYGFIENLFHNGVAVGHGDGTYRPNDAVTRAQVAVFLMKAKLGATSVPPPATGTVFNDVHAGDFAADWIEQLAGFRITGGCGNGNYCPNDPVTRAQAAVLLLKSEHGSAYTPPNCTGIFTDVECSPTPAFAVNWIEQLHNEDITGGCGTNPLIFCPGSSVTRGQAAVFLVKTLGLRLYGP